MKPRTQLQRTDDAILWWLFNSPSLKHTWHQTRRFTNRDIAHHAGFYVAYRAALGSLQRLHTTGYLDKEPLGAGYRWRVRQRDSQAS